MAQCLLGRPKGPDSGAEVSLGVVRCHLGGPEGGTRYCGWAEPPHFFRGAGSCQINSKRDTAHIMNNPHIGGVPVVHIATAAFFLFSAASIAMAGPPISIPKDPIRVPGATSPIQKEEEVEEKAVAPLDIQIERRALVIDLGPLPKEEKQQDTQGMSPRPQRIGIHRPLPREFIGDLASLPRMDPRKRPPKGRSNVRCRRCRISAHRHPCKTARRYSCSSVRWRWSCSRAAPHTKRLHR